MALIERANEPMFRVSRVTFETQMDYWCLMLLLVELTTGGSE